MTYQAESEEELDLELGCATNETLAENSHYPYPEASLLTGSLFHGGKAGDLLCGYVQLVDESYGYCEAKGGEYFIRIEKLSTIQSLQGCGETCEDSSSLFYYPLSILRDEKLGKGTYLYTQCCFYHAGEYSVKFVKILPKEKVAYNTDSKTTKDINLGWGERLITISPGKAYASTCELSQGSVGKDNTKYILQVHRGEECSLLVRLKDRFGNFCTTGDDEVKCVGVGHTHVNTPVNRHNGEFEIRFVLMKDTAALQINGCLVKDSLIYLQDITAYKESDKSEIFSKNKKSLHPKDLAIPAALPSFLLLDSLYLNSWTSPSIFPELYGNSQHLKRLEDELLAVCQTITTTNYFPKRCKDFDVALNVSASLEKLRAVSQQDAFKIIETQKHIQYLYDKIVNDDCVELPEKLEIQDVNALKEKHKEILNHLHHVETDLQNRLETLCQRSSRHNESRQQLVEALTRSIQEHQDILAQHITLNERINKEIRSRIIKLKKKQQRKEIRRANHPDAIVALRAELMQKAMDQHMRQKQEIQPKQAVGNGLPVKNKSEEKEKSIFHHNVVSAYPSDPRNPAFWIAEGRFRKSYLKQHDSKDTGTFFEHPFLARVNRYGIRLDQAVDFNELEGV